MYSKKIILFISISVFSMFFLRAQTKSERTEITKNYNLKKINTLAKEFKILEIKQKKEALQKAAENNWPIKFIDKDGSFHELIRLSETGRPVYYQTFNRKASLSTRAKWLNTDGGMGLNINGEAMTAYVWDGSHVNVDHIEFSNAAGDPTRATLEDTSVPDYGEYGHGCHVCGTIAAYGGNVDAKGMAPKTLIKSYDWNGDTSEVISATAQGMLLSNHSYGIGVTSSGGPDIEDWKIGAYTSESRVWDLVAYNAPYHLKVVAAGNDGNNNYGNGDPMEGNSAYDKMIGDCVSKNTMIVAAAYDLNVDANGNPINSPTIAGFSSEGPTDDYRVKPDITGNGVGVKSTLPWTNTSYGSMDGTSMASPNVMGSLLLLQQLNNEENGEFLLSSSLRGLALHTATDGGMVGPDAKFGWGYLNTKKAAECILNNGTSSKMEVFDMQDGDSYTFVVSSDEVNSLQASICWTDPPGFNTANNASDANRTDPVLVHDLDIRISKGSTVYYPWRLTSVSTNDKIDNEVDNFERIDVDGATGDYTITVSHKGTLLTGNQVFSLVITGISNFINLDVNELKQSSINIWPNPSHGIFNISVEDCKELSISITDVLGKTVLSENHKNLSNTFIKQYNLNFLRSGVYFINLKDENNTITKKIIIE